MYKLHEEGRKNSCKSAGRSPRHDVKHLTGEPRSESGDVQSNTRLVAPRLQGRRRSEPVVMMGIDVEDIRRMMDKITGVKEGQYKKSDKDRDLSPEPQEPKDESDFQRDRQGSVAKMNLLEEKRPDSSLLMPIHPYEIMMRRGSVEGYRILKPKESRAKTSKPRSSRGADKSMLVEERRVRSSVQRSPRDATMKYHLDKRAKTSKSRPSAHNDLKVEGGQFGQIVPKKLKSQRPKSVKRPESVQSTSNKDQKEPYSATPTIEVTEVDLMEGDGSQSTDEELQEVWDDVRRCRYIRGYDPPEMRLPSGDASEFVFGRSYSDAHTFIKTGKLP